MKSFLKVCEETSKRLGRPLEQKEVSFLQWIHKRYEEEQKGMSKTFERIDRLP